MPVFSWKTEEVCCVFLFVLMGYLLHQDRKHDARIHRSFVWLIITAFGYYALDLLSHYISQFPGAYLWCKLFGTLEYIIKPAMLCGILQISERDSTKRRKILLTIPLLLLTLALIVSFPFHWVFYYTPDTNGWRGGPLLPITWIPLLIYMVWIMVSSIRLHGFREESRLLLIGESFIALNIVNERFFSMLPDVEHTVIIVAILAYYLYHRSYAETEYRVMKEKELSQARMEAMISQIKPHFIYNSLACIAETCHQDALKGEEAILTFSGYLRNCFQSLTDDGLVPFAEELKTIESYMELEIMQAPEKLSVVYDIRERFFRVPMLSIETLVENAVKHGIRKKHGHGTVTLRTERDEHGLRITIADDGIGFDTAKELPDENHLGLKNARMRLVEQCGATMEVDSRLQEGTVITIIIPEGEHR